ncbi:MAG: heavy metal translocating P-type ATPase metal-binding domain-containing protein [Bacteroidetes bacterium]|nr:heavy metal translocating P-type ATPase metal-binding domain-containing protein [Bacteroidota bacterium]
MGVKCVHCGEDCGKHPVMWDEKPFCCYGCKTVYEILNVKKLDKYYEIEPMSGIKVEQTDVGDKYAYLDLDEIREKILSFSDSGISKVNLFIPTIHCASCIWLLENLSTLNPGIIQSGVNFPNKTVSITFKDQEISLRQLVEMLVSIHYIPEISLDQLDTSSSTKASRDLLLKIGVAGFSLLNVMLYNFPEYLPGGELLEKEFMRYFGWLSFILSLPVVFYSASDYYLSAYKGLKHKMINIDVPITLGIFTLFIQSTYEIITGSGIGFLDSLVGLVFLLLIGKWYQGKTYQALSFERDYKSYFPVAVTKLINDKEESTPLQKITTGDRILIRNQELIPADAKLLSDHANIDYSFVTGESIPTPKKAGELIFAGGRQVGGIIQLEVIHEVEQSYLTQLWNQDNKKTTVNSGLDTLINKVSEYFTVIILLIATIAAVYWLFNDPSLAVFAFTSVLIIACPCALALTVPFTFGSTMRAFGRKGFYIKNTQVIEDLHKIDTIVFDKTGTLTHSRSMDAKFVGDTLSEEEQIMIKSLAANSSHPLSATIKDAIPSTEYFEVEDFKEIPAMGTTGLVSGKRVNIGSKKFVTGKDDLDVGSTNVYVFIDQHIKGYFKIENRYRDGLKQVIDNLKNNYQLFLLSGDNEAEKKNLSPVFGSETKLFFNQSPTDKMTFVKKLKKEGRKVLMVGDGLNDAGALMQSDVGLTIADDIYSFSPACDGIIESSKFSIIDRFINYTQTSLNIVKISFVISFLYNVVGIYFAVQGTLSPLIAAILMPLSSISVVAFATFMVNYTSRGIGIVKK